jgi:hypothetical protein
MRQNLRIRDFTVGLGGGVLAVWGGFGLLRALPKFSKKRRLSSPEKILQKRSRFGSGPGFFGGDDDGGGSRKGGQAQGVVVLLEDAAEGFDDEVVVVALRQAGDRDRADDARACDVDGEAAAVGGVVGVG